jgi:hypothetical protein
MLSGWNQLSPTNQPPETLFSDSFNYPKEQGPSEGELAFRSGLCMQLLVIAPRLLQSVQRVAGEEKDFDKREKLSMSWYDWLLLKRNVTHFGAQTFGLAKLIPVTDLPVLARN